MAMPLTNMFKRTNNILLPIASAFNYIRKIFCNTIVVIIIIMALDKNVNVCVCGSFLQLTLNLKSHSLILFSLLLLLFSYNFAVHFACKLFTIYIAFTRDSHKKLLENPILLKFVAVVVKTPKEHELIELINFKSLLLCFQTIFL